MSSRLSYEEQHRQAITAVEHYRTNLNVKRQVLSKTLSDLIQYTQQHLGEDVLIYPVKDNPFVPPKRPCTLL